MPSALPIHPVFHVSKLKRFVSADGTFPNQKQEPTRPLPELVDEKEEYQVEVIRDHRLRPWKGEMHKQYLVKWKGYPEWENTWEWWDTLEKAKNIVNRYERSLQEN